MLVIDGNSSPTARDVDDWIERKGSIKQAFDGGVRAEAGARTLIPNVNRLETWTPPTIVVSSMYERTYVQRYFFTKKVVFTIVKIYSNSKGDEYYEMLIVMDRHTSGYELFSAHKSYGKSEWLPFRYCDRQKTTYDVSDRGVNWIRKAVSSFDEIEYVVSVSSGIERLWTEMDRSKQRGQAMQSDIEHLRAEMDRSLQRDQAMQSDIERLRTELDRSQRAQADQRAQDWCVMSNAAVLMVTLSMAAAYLM
jgi:hypothetical protein